MDIQTRIELHKSDPQIIGGLYPIPEDERLYSRLGQDYENYIKLKSDGHISSKLQKRGQAVVGRKIIIEAGSGKLKSKEAVAIAQAILSKISYERFCLELLEDGQLLGFTVQQIDYEEVEDEALGTLIVPRFKHVPNYRFTFGYHEQKSAPTVNDEPLEMDAIAMVRGYELRLLTKQFPVTGVRVPKNRFLCYCFGGHSPWGLGLGYQVYGWWIVKTEIRKAWLLRSDRLGSPPVLGAHPPSLDRIQSPDAKAALENWRLFLRSISPNGWYDGSEGFKAQLVETIASVNSDDLQKLFNEANREISKAILGEESFSEKSTGSYAANTSQVEDRESSLTDADCNLLDEQLQPLWNYLIALNAPSAKAPIVRRWTTNDMQAEIERKQAEESRRQRAESDRLLIQDLGLKPSDRYIKETYGEDWSV